MCFKTNSMTTATYMSQSPASSRSILSRIVPFRPKPRHISDFHIRTDEPFRQHAPGDVVKGSVLLSFQKPVRITHLVLSLRGFVKVYKNANPHGGGIAREGAGWGPGRGTRGAEYFGNGLASIFEDEVVLCGEGRLAVNSYAFQFELHFPSSNTPSSIDFERGTISYVLTATLTRPTTISPTLTCERNVCLIESIDIAHLAHPKPRVITLKPIRRSKPRSQSKPSLADAKKSTKSKDPIVRAHRPESSAIVVRAFDPPHSPAPSAVSSGSVVSSSSTSFQVASEVAKSSSKALDEPGHIEARPDGTITATIEMLRGGCLPGDSIPLVISIDHTKVVKRLQGIIITLYRLGRVDRQPLVPIGPSAKGREATHEDYYPRSRTGLGGLSLSSADSTHAFRMDLAQSFAPLIVDPVTMNATTRTSIQVPDDVFPTISCTPGAMITFKYFVEVIVDIRGKLASQDRFLPRMTMTGAPSAYGHSHVSNHPISIQQNSTTTSQPMVDADQIRRDKSVVSCLFEIVVGTKDSQRKVGKQRADFWEEIVPMAPFEDGRLDGYDYDDEYPIEHSMVGEGADRYDHAPYDYSNHSWEGHASALGPLVIPPPDLEEARDEKARIRMAEERLLPSAPPVNEEALSAYSVANVPSAPTLSDINEEYHPTGSSAPAYSGHAAASSETITPRQVAVSYQGTPTGGSSQHGMQLGDDKQEMERQRLLAAASAPPDMNTDDEEEGGSRQTPAPAPSAPVLDEEGGYHPSPYHYNT